MEELGATVAEWERRMCTAPGSFDAPADVVARAADWAGQLREGQPRRLLHGDLNPGNVLATGRGRWSAIDPKPWFGDPAFDLAQLLMNWALAMSTEDAAQATLRQARQLADRLSLDVGRVLRWAVVKAVGWRAPRRVTAALDAAARLHVASPSTFMHRLPASPP